MIPVNLNVFLQRSRLFDVVAVFLGLLVTSCGNNSTPTPQSQPSSMPATSASTPNASSTIGEVFLGDVSKLDSVLAIHSGRWILINVWATWCRPCVAETPELVALHRSLGGKAFSLIGISADYMTSPTAEEAINKVRTFGTQHQIPFPNVIYTGSTDDLTARFSLGGTIPTSILYDPQGKEIGRWTGRLVDEDFARIKKLVS